MLMDELKDAVHVPLDKVDIPRSAVSAVGIGSASRRREKYYFARQAKEQPPRIEPDRL